MKPASALRLLRWIVLALLLSGLGRRVTAALMIDVPDEQVVRRISGRRTCVKSGHNYHVDFDPPKHEGICDQDGSRLVQRDDDKADAQAFRFEVWEGQLVANREVGSQADVAAAHKESGEREKREQETEREIKIGGVVDGAKLAGADLRGAEVSGLDLRRLASYRDLKIAADQQFRLLDAMGLDVQVE